MLEVCVDSIAGLLAAEAGGAQRIELCARLDLGGLSPARELLDAAIARTKLPLHVMVRPRAGDFVATAAELLAMEAEIAGLRDRGGVAGVVFGVLTPAGRVDVAATRRLLAAARPLSVTFHRAFDAAADLDQALEDLVELGVDRILSSGGAADAYAGRARLGELVRRARGRLVVMAGGGVRPGNVAAILAETGVLEVHGSVPLRLPGREGYRRSSQE
ncbi:MAG TPA: copper homeostasis protein CutC [Planctomycetota bacterium]|jgi:copper homeostasis protein|nr:copper homeostasis protein CutC [Planctomycetota bacterium]